MRFHISVAAALTIIMAAVQTSGAAAPWEGMPADKTCVGYQTTKKMFLVSNVDVVGINCAVTAETDGKGKVRVTIPVDGFDSGNQERDEHVGQILGGAGLAPMVFESPIPTKDALGAESFTVSGGLVINGERHPMEVSFTKEADQVYVFNVSAKLSELGVTVPKVGLGLVAAPSDDITLFGRVLQASLAQ